MHLHKRHQHGSALVISLLILLVLTVIGATALNSSIMEEKMASNFQTGNMAYQAAESAVNLTHARVAWNYNLVDQVINARNLAQQTGNPAVWPTVTYNINGSPTNAAATIQYVGENEPCPGGSMSETGTVSMLVRGTGTVNATGASRTHSAGIIKCNYVKQ